MGGRLEAGEKQSTESEKQTWSTLRGTFSEEREENFRIQLLWSLRNVTQEILNNWIRLKEKKAQETDVFIYNLFHRYPPTEWHVIYHIMVMYSLQPHLLQYQNIRAIQILINRGYLSYGTSMQWNNIIL